MSKLWDDLKKNMKDWGSVAVEKAEEVSKIAVAKTEEITKISKNKIDIHQLQKERAKTKSAKVGDQFGATIERQEPIILGDELESYRIVEK